MDTSIFSKDSPYSRILSLIRGTMQNLNCTLANKEGLDFINYNLRGVGQVVFINNPISGLLILIALFVQSFGLGMMAILGVVSSTSTSILLCSDRNDIRNGIYGYNGVLVGVAIATLGTSNNKIWNLLAIAIPVVILSAFTTILMKILSSWWIKTFKSPPLTLPFNVITLLFLGWVKLISELDSGHQEVLTNIPSSVNYSHIVMAIFIGFGQIFLADKLITGLLIFLAILVFSPIAAAVSLIGSAIGLGTGFILNAGIEDIYAGLWCYNSILSSMAIGGIFYVPSLSSYVIAAESACLSAIMVLILEICLKVTGLPVLTLPFCVTTIVLFVVLERFSPTLVPVSLHAISSPEEHRQKYLEAREAILKFRCQLERLMLNKPSYFWFDLADQNEKINLQYVFHAITAKDQNRISMLQVRQYLKNISQPSSLYTLEYLVQFMKVKNTEMLNYKNFCELVFRYKNIMTKLQPLTDYLLPLDKQKTDPISFEEINLVFTKTSHLPLTKMQLTVLQDYIGSNYWTWEQFIKVLLTA